MRVWAGGTLNGNPISAAAGLAALEVLAQPGTYEHLHRLGRRLRDGIRELGGARGFPVQTPGEDAVFGVRFLENPAPVSWTDLLASDRDLGQQWAMQMIARGILVNPNEKIYLSTAHTDSDIDRALEATASAFDTLADSGERDTPGSDQ
jgi:glutamate-1-semialdehyde 2,1-aminomutase